MFTWKPFAHALVLTPKQQFIKADKILRIIESQIMQPIRNLPRHPASPILLPPNQWISTLLTARLAIIPKCQHRNIKQMPISAFRFSSMPQFLTASTSPPNHPTSHTTSTHPSPHPTTP